MTNYLFHITANPEPNPELFFDAFFLIDPEGNIVTPLWTGECQWQRETCVYACTGVSPEIQEKWNQTTDLVAVMTFTNDLHRALDLPHDNFDLVYKDWGSETLPRWTLMATEHEEGQDWITRGLNALG